MQQGLRHEIISLTLHTLWDFPLSVAAHVADHTCSFELWPQFFMVLPYDASLQNQIWTIISARIQ